MDARAFAETLKTSLNEKAKEYEAGLLAVSYETYADGKRLSGIRDTLIGISGSIDGLLRDFLAKGAPAPTQPSYTVTPVEGEIV